MVCVCSCHVCVSPRVCQSAGVRARVYQSAGGCVHQSVSLRCPFMPASVILEGQLAAVSDSLAVS